MVLVNVNALYNRQCRGCYVLFDLRG